MINLKVIGLFLTTIVILAINLIGFTSCTGNQEGILAVPEFEVPEPPPVNVTIDQIYAEYMADEAAADAKYEWEKLCFYEVEVEQVVSKKLQMSGSTQQFIKIYFTAGSVKFVLRGEDWGLMQNIEEGYVLNIVGEGWGLQGLSRDTVAIYNCWVESVIGDLGTGEQEDFY